MMLYCGFCSADCEFNKRKAAIFSLLKNDHEKRRMLFEEEGKILAGQEIGLMIPGRRQLVKADRDLRQKDNYQKIRYCRRGAEVAEKRFLLLKAGRRLHVKNIYLFVSSHQIVGQGVDKVGSLAKVLFTIADIGP